MLNRFIELSERTIESVDTRYTRNQISLLRQPERLIGIKGSRGVGKTTLLLQYAKSNLEIGTRLYISLDNPFFAKNNLPEFVDEYIKNGGKHLLLDEVHHYKDWSASLKHIYDNYKDLHIIYTGSSLLHLTKGRADLSRRSMLNTLNGLSLREYINLTKGTDFPAYSLDEILSGHMAISRSINEKVKPVKEYNDYNQVGYYPFFLENRNTYHFKLMEIINQVIESDLPLVANINYSNVSKMKQLLQIIAESVPYKPNLEKLGGLTGLSINTLKDYLYYLNEAMLISLLRSDKKGISKLAKPEKIYLHHPNLMFCLATENANQGSIRESFFFNQVKALFEVGYTDKGDFSVGKKYIFEIGGKNKKYRQIANIGNSYIAADDLETGFKNTIPLWLFGFLY